MSSRPSTERVLSAIERNRNRVWRLCYRMTGSRAQADDLAQESLARAIERSQQLGGLDATGWLLRVATTTCLDHLRRVEVRRRANQLVDFLDAPGLQPGDAGPSPEEHALLREDVRYAIVVALQHLPPRQRAVLVLREICDRSLDEIAETLGVQANTCKVLLFRARATLRRVRPAHSIDCPVDREVVERLAQAIEAGDLDAAVGLFADDVWGIVDGGGRVRTAGKPTFGRSVVARQWTNAYRRLGHPELRCELRRLNGQEAIVVRVLPDPGRVVAVLHLETNASHVQSMCVDRDPGRVDVFGALH